MSDSPIESTKQADAEICRACGFTRYNHVGNTGVPYPCWTPSGRYSRDKHTNEPRESTKELHESKERKPEPLKEVAELDPTFVREVIQSTYAALNPDEEAIGNDSPNWNNPAIEALRKRGYKRINDPRVGLSRGAEPEMTPQELEDEAFGNVEEESPPRGEAETPTDTKLEQLLYNLRLAYRGMHRNLAEEEDDIACSEKAVRQRIRELLEEAREKGFIQAKAEVAVRLVEGGATGSIRV